MKSVEWIGDHLRIIDQSKLPAELVYLDLSDYRDIVSAIKDMKVRGAPAIGIAAAYGIALGASAIIADDMRQFSAAFNHITQEFAASRPTAVNLFHTINTMQLVIKNQNDMAIAKKILIETALNIHQREEIAMSKLSIHGAALINDGFTVLTHCNAGQLATGTTYGTALGVIKAATEQGKHVRVFADETRPVLQGARLTTWELQQQRIPVTLITDSMAGHFMYRKMINCVIVGADRIAANGDVANKVGTYSVAVLAKENHIPFYVAAPTSTIDRNIKSGSEIVIENRSPREITEIKGCRIVPPDIEVSNPSFDITPHQYITAIITERGITSKPYDINIDKLFQEDI